MFNGSNGSTMPVSPSLLRMLLRPDLPEAPGRREPVPANAARLDDIDFAPFCLHHKTQSCHD